MHRRARTSPRGLVYARRFAITLVLLAAFLLGVMLGQQLHRAASLPDLFSIILRVPPNRPCYARDELSAFWLRYLLLPGSVRPGLLLLATRVEQRVEAFSIECRLWTTGDVEAAVDEFLTLLGGRPNHGETLQRLRQLLEGLPSDSSKAERWYCFGRIMPGEKWAAAEEIAQIGAALSNAGQWQEAERLHRMAGTLDPDDMTHRRLLADALLAQERSREAFDRYAELLWAAPESAHFAIGLNAASMQMDQPELATQFWRELHAAHPEAVAPGLHMGRLFEAEGKTASALDLYLRLHEKHPDNADLLLALGVLTAKEDSYAKGRVFMDRAVELNPALRDVFTEELKRLAARYAEEGAFAFAEAIEREVANFAAPDLAPPSEGNTAFLSVRAPAP